MLDHVTRNRIPMKGGGGESFVLPGLQWWLDPDTDVTIRAGSIKTGQGDSLTDSGANGIITKAAENFGSPLGMATYNAVWIDGATNPGNNGVFRTISGSGTQCTYSNTAAVTETSAFDWEVMGQIESGVEQVNGYVFALNGAASAGWGVPANTRTFSPHTYAINFGFQSSLLSTDPAFLTAMAGPGPSYHFAWAALLNPTVNGTRRFVDIGNGSYGTPTQFLRLEVLASVAGTQARVVFSQADGGGATTYQSPVLTTLGDLSVPRLYGYANDGAGNTEFFVSGVSVGSAAGVARSPGGFVRVVAGTQNGSAGGANITSLWGGGYGGVPTAKSWQLLNAYVSALKA